MSRAFPWLLDVWVRRRLAGQDVGQLLDVGTRDDRLSLLVLLAQPVDELGAQDVDLPVQDAPRIRHLLLFLRVLLDELLELLVGERTEVREAVVREILFGHEDGHYSLDQRLRVGLFAQWPGT